jgi:hypothetical protein
VPSKNETYQYKMLSDEALAKFRIFCAAGRFPRTDGAYDSRPRYASDQREPPVDDMVELIRRLCAENRRLKGVASDAAAPTGDYADIPRELSEFIKELPTALPPEIYERWRGRLSALVARTAELVRAVNAAINERADGDQPPPFEGRPKRAGGVAGDDKPAWSRLLPDPEASRERMHANMSRINVIG